jgi:hypothetical protein
VKPLGERIELEPPHAMIAQRAMHQHNRIAVASLDVIEGRSVNLHYRHDASSLIAGAINLSAVSWEQLVARGATLPATALWVPLIAGSRRARTSATMDAVRTHTRSGTANRREPHASPVSITMSNSDRVRPSATVPILSVLSAAVA